MSTTSSPFLSNSTPLASDYGVNQPTVQPQAFSNRNSHSKRGLWSSLRFKAILFAVGLGTLPILVVGVAGTQVTRRITTAQVLERQKGNAEQLTSEFSSFLFARYGDITVLAKQPIFADAQFRDNTTVAEKEAFLDAYLSAYGEIYDSISFLDKQGDDVAVSGAVAHKNHADDIYFRQAMSLGRPFISQPKLINSPDKAQHYQFYIAAPVKDSKTGEVIGVVRSRVLADSLANLLNEFKGTSNVHVADAAGKIFISTEVAETLKDSATQEKSNEEVKDSTQQEINEFSGQRADKVFSGLPAVRQKFDSGSFFTTDAINQEKELMGYASTPVIGEMQDLGWFVLTETDLEDAFRAQKELENIFFWGTLLSIITVSLIAGLITNRSVRPIEATALAVEQFGQGNFSSRLAIKGDDELATLGANVNRMANQIQGLLETLQRSARQLGQQNNVLSELARNEALIQGDAKATAWAFTEAIAQTLNVARVGIWVYDGDRNHLICFDQYDQGQQQHSKNDSLYASEVPDYFQQLEVDPLIVANTVQDQPAVQALLDAERLLLDTTSVLNIPIQISGRTAGVIRCEQVQTAREWQTDEQTFVASVANLMSIALESEVLQQEVSHLLDVVSDVEDGDLTLQANVSDRTTGLIADIFNRLLERLTAVLAQVSEAAQQVSQNASQQKQMAEIVAQNTGDQAQAVEQVLQLTQQVEQVAQRSAEKVSATATSLQTMQTAVGQGRETITTLNEGITVLQDGSDRIIQQMKTLGEFVSLADQFVQDQSQIASLTQTLALNASLVAARASEQRDPRQFAVVAREFDLIANQVSQLAQKTNDSLNALEQRSNQIHSVVSVIDGSVQNLGGLVKGFTQGVEQSSQVFSDVQVVTSEAVTASTAVTQANQEVIDAAQTAAQVVREIAAIATRTAELTQSTRIKSEEMDMLSNQLLQTIQFFRLPAPVDLDQDDQSRVVLAELPLATLTVDSVEIDAGSQS